MAEQFLPTRRTFLESKLAHHPQGNLLDLGKLVRTFSGIQNAKLKSKQFIANAQLMTKTRILGEQQLKAQGKKPFFPRNPSLDYYIAGAMKGLTIHPVDEFFHFDTPAYSTATTIHVTQRTEDLMEKLSPGKRRRLTRRVGSPERIHRYVAAHELGHLLDFTASPKALKDVDRHLATEVDFVTSRMTRAGKAVSKEHLTKIVDTLYTQQPGELVASIFAESYLTTEPGKLRSKTAVPKRHRKEVAERLKSIYKLFPAPFLEAPMKELFADQWRDDAIAKMAGMLSPTKVIKMKGQKVTDAAFAYGVANNQSPLKVLASGTTRGTIKGAFQGTDFYKNIERFGSWEVDPQSKKLMMNMSDVSFAVRPRLVTAAEKKAWSKVRPYNHDWALPIYMHSKKADVTVQVGWMPMSGFEGRGGRRFAGMLPRSASGSEFPLKMGSLRHVEKVKRPFYTANIAVMPQQKDPSGNIVRRVLPLGRTVESYEYDLTFSGQVDNFVKNLGFKKTAIGLGALVGLSVLGAIGSRKQSEPSEDQYPYPVNGVYGVDTGRITEAMHPIGDYGRFQTARFRQGHGGEVFQIHENANMSGYKDVRRRHRNLAGTPPEVKPARQHVNRSRAGCC